MQKADDKYKAISTDGAESIHPRLMHHIIDEGSWNDDEQIQQMWAGLLASSCTRDGNDQSNLLFINLLKELTSLQAAVINYACENYTKEITKAGWIASNSLPMELDDFHQLDRELDHLRSVGLIHHGFDESSTCAELSPTALALQLFVRSQGYLGSPVEYFNLQP